MIQFCTETNKGQSMADTQHIYIYLPIGVIFCCCLNIRWFVARHICSDINIELPVEIIWIGRRMSSYLKIYFDFFCTNKIYV